MSRPPTILAEKELRIVLSVLQGEVSIAKAARREKVLKNGRAKAVRFTTLDALCEVLECQPGDLLRREGEDAAP